MFYVYFTTPDEGLYVSTASNPAGPWSPLVRMVQGAGWDDPAPFWDDDGQGYLAMTRFAADPATGKTYNIHLYELSADGKALVANWDHIIYQGQGSEANKLYKFNGYYYHFFSEVTGEGRVPFTSRAQVITGPWETPHALIHVTAANGGPNQGAILQTDGGNWVFITHHGTAVWYGRGASLLPVTWTNGWPAAGRVGADGIGNMVSSAPKPVLGYPITAPQTDDDFSSPVLRPQWEWFFQPRADKWSLTERPGFLRLHAFKPLAAGDLSKTGNVLTQRPLGAAHNVATATIDISNMADGQMVGLGFLGNAWAAVGVQQEKGVRHFVYSRSGQADRDRGCAVRNADDRRSADVLERSSRGHVRREHGSDHVRAARARPSRSRTSGTTSAPSWPSIPRTTSKRLDTSTSTASRIRVPPTD